jgi:hypothetical protein
MRVHFSSSWVFAAAASKLAAAADEAEVEAEPGGVGFAVVRAEAVRLPRSSAGRPSNAVSARPVLLSGGRGMSGCPPGPGPLPIADERLACCHFVVRSTYDNVQAT